MTYLEKFEELRQEFNIDDTCEIIINESNTQVFYQITDEEDTTLYIDFDLENNIYTVSYDTPDEGLVFESEKIF